VSPSCRPDDYAALGVGFMSSKAIALSVGFRRWRRRDPWECRRCGAAVVDAQAHARWHASTEAGARRVPPNSSVWSERRRDTQEITVHVGEDGWDLR
jgi:hypothetical protein